MSIIVNNFYNYINTNYCSWNILTITIRIHHHCTGTRVFGQRTFCHGTPLFLPLNVDYHCRQGVIKEPKDLPRELEFPPSSGNKQHCSTCINAKYHFLPCLREVAIESSLFLTLLWSTKKNPLCLELCLLSQWRSQRELFILEPWVAFLFFRQQHCQNVYPKLFFVALSKHLPGSK